MPKLKAAREWSHRVAFHLGWTPEKHRQTGILLDERLIRVPLGPTHTVTGNESFFLFEPTNERINRFSDSIPPLSPPTIVLSFARI